MEKLITDIRACQICATDLPNAPKPIIQASIHSKVLIIGQAPGQKVQISGIPWDDASGKELRRWMGVTKEQFYNPDIFALMPMGFCYPGKGSSGDLPPRPECAPKWHRPLLAMMNNIKLTLLIGQYAQKKYLGIHYKTTLTENIMAYKTYLPQYLPLVHPSPRNKIWQKKNPWFETDLIPELQNIISRILK